MRAYREYGRRWIDKHPTAFDFFHTFDDVSGRDLSWFWRTWFYETWTLDQAVAGVQSAGDSTTITIEDRGLAPYAKDNDLTLEECFQTLLTGLAVRYYKAVAS